MIRVTRVLEQRLELARKDTERAPPASDSRRDWRERVTLLLVVEDGEGRVGLGEASPLPGYSPDTLDDAWDSLTALLGASLGLEELGPGASQVLRAVTAAVASPSARFALETALLDLWSKQRAEPAWVLLARIRSELFDVARGPLAVATEGHPVAALLPGSGDAALAHAEHAFARGIRCFKTKLGVPGGWSGELATLRALRKRFPEARLRVDANQALSPEELWQRLPALRDLALEWLEEPIAHFPDGIDWEVGVPLALDESLQRDPPEPSVAREHAVRAYVLKPTTLGGFVRSFELANEASRAELVFVASHAYEGPVGFSALAALSLALGSDRPPDGLDAHAGVADAPALPAFDYEAGRVFPWTEPGFGLALEPLLARRPVTREARA
jgi:o-succinylbenzoate synthase